MNVAALVNGNDIMIVIHAVDAPVSEAVTSGCLHMPSSIGGASTGPDHAHVCVPGPERGHDHAVDHDHEHEHEHDHIAGVGALRA